MVRSDSLAALGALNKVSGGTSAINRVVRETALDLAEGSYVVDVVSHIPACRSALDTFPVPSETQLTIAAIVCRPLSSIRSSRNRSSASYGSCTS